MNGLVVNSEEVEVGCCEEILMVCNRRRGSGGQVLPRRSFQENSTDCDLSGRPGTNLPVEKAKGDSQQKSSVGESALRRLANSAVLVGRLGPPFRFRLRRLAATLQTFGRKFPCEMPHLVT
jgi:hypothetical protein